MSRSDTAVCPRCKRPTAYYDQGTRSEYCSVACTIIQVYQHWAEQGCDCAMEMRNGHVRLASVTVNGTRVDFL